MSGECKNCAEHCLDCTCKASSTDVKRLDMTIDKNLYRIQDMIRQISVLNDKCESNMKNLHAMMLELKGIVAMVRPQVKKTGWYGEEIKGSVVKGDMVLKTIGHEEHLELNANT